jgi:acyl carrier protein
MNIEHGGENGSGNRQVLDRIRHLISQVCMVDATDIGRNARLLAFGIDSIRVIELMMHIEDEFQIHLEPADLGEIVTVGQLADYVEKLCVFEQPE